jgi:hypothetical protein
VRPTENILGYGESLEGSPGSDNRHDNDGQASAFVPSVVYEAVFKGGGSRR